MLTLFLLLSLLILFFRFRSADQLYVLLSILGAVFWIAVGTYEEFFSKAEFVKDQHFYMSQVASLCKSGSLLNDDIRYVFYPYFIYSSSFCLDYVSSSVLAKLSFSFLWAILVGFISVESSNKNDDYWRKFVLLTIVVIGWFFSAHLLRDGLVAIGFALLFLAFLCGGGRLKKATLLFAGLLFILFTRPQFIPILFLAYFIVFFLLSFLKYSQPFRAISIVFSFSILALLFVPIPVQLGEIMALYLVPHANIATEKTVYDIQQIGVILMNGGWNASSLLFNQMITRFPSVFYEPNPLRTVVWFFSIDQLGSNDDFRRYSLILRASTELVSWVFIALLAWAFLIGKESYRDRLGSVFSFFWAFFLLAATIYIVKYSGFSHRIFLAFVVSLLILSIFRPPNNNEIKRIILPTIVVWSLFQLAYLLIKPFDFIWNYF